MERRRVAGAEVRSVDRFFEFSLFGMLVSGYLALVGSGRLAAPVIALTACVLVFRLLVITGLTRFPLADKWITAIAIAYVAFYPLDYYFFSQDFLRATAHLVLFLAAVRVLSARSYRDHAQLVLIAFLEMLAGALLSANLNYFLFLILFLLFAVATFAAWEMRHSMQSPATVARGASRISWRLGLLSVGLGLGVLVMTAAVFFVLPRSARAAFRGLVPERYHLTGLSGEVTLGQIGEIQQQSTVLMHVRIPGVQDVRGFKWRGSALAEFDGRRWFNPDAPGETLRVREGQVTLADDAQRRRAGRRLNYEIRLQPMASDVLFVAGTPEFLRLESPLVVRTPEDSFRVAFPSPQLLRYGVYAYFEPGPDRGAVSPLTPEERADHLQLPDLDPRIAALAEEVTADFSSSREKAEALEAYLSTSYRYTLELPTEESDDPIAQFLFDRRAGHCEYFASAMAVMLRQVGIPSRVATGFQGGLYNPISGWHLLRASDAHSWVEAWLPGTGWTSFDPTPAAPAAAGVGLWTRLSLVTDAAEVFWREWVLSYDPDRRRSLAARVDEARRTVSAGWSGQWRKRWSAVPGIVAGWLREYNVIIIALAAVALAARQRRRITHWWKAFRRRSRMEQGDAEASDATILYERALAMLRRRGIEKPAWLTPLEFASAVPSPPLREILGDLARAYNDLRYGGRQDAAVRMLVLLDRLKTAR